MKAEYRNITNSPGSSFTVNFFKEKAFPAVWHFHPQYELTFILQSTGVRYVGDNIQNFEPGDLVLVGSNLPHCWMTEGPQEEEVACIIIQWNVDLLENLLDRSEFILIKNLLESSNRGIRFHGEIIEEIKHNLKEMEQMNSFERFVKLLTILQQLASEKNIELLTGPGYNNKLSMNESYRVNKIHNFISENYQRKISLIEIANVVNMTKESFCRFFKKNFNKPFFQFVNEYKINLASKMLINSDLTVSEIGYRVGYQNLTFFHRQFIKFMSVSPSKYRKIYQRIPSVFTNFK